MTILAVSLVSTSSNVLYPLCFAKIAVSVFSVLVFCKISNIAMKKPGSGFLESSQIWHNAALIHCFTAYLWFAFISHLKLFYMYFSDGPGVGIAELKAPSRHCSTLLTIIISVINTVYRYCFHFLQAFPYRPGFLFGSTVICNGQKEFTSTFLRISLKRFSDSGVSVAEFIQLRATRTKVALARQTA